MIAKQVLLRAKKYLCIHKLAGVFPYWAHRAYEVEIVGHGWTMAPKKSQVAAWALDWLASDPDNDGYEWEVMIEWS
jgi:hypothetical protein